jgi:hypothetical protein
VTLLDQALLEAAAGGDQLALAVVADLLEEKGPYHPYPDGGDYGWWRGVVAVRDDASLPEEVFDRLPRKVSANNQLFPSARSAFLALAHAISEGATLQ